MFMQQIKTIVFISRQPEQWWNHQKIINSSASHEKIQQYIVYRKKTQNKTQASFQVMTSCHQKKKMDFIFISKG